MPINITKNDKEVKLVYVKVDDQALGAPVGTFPNQRDGWDALVEIMRDSSLKPVVAYDSYDYSGAKNLITIKFKDDSTAQQFVEYVQTIAPKMELVNNEKETIKNNIKTILEDGSNKARLESKKSTAPNIFTWLANTFSKFLAFLKGLLWEPKLTIDKSEFKEQLIHPVTVNDVNEQLNLVTVKESIPINADIEKIKNDIIASFLSREQNIKSKQKSKDPKLRDDGLKELEELKRNIDFFQQVQVTEDEDRIIGYAKAYLAERKADVYASKTTWIISNVYYSDYEQKDLANLSKHLNKIKPQ